MRNAIELPPSWLRYAGSAAAAVLTVAAIAELQGYTTLTPADWFLALGTGVCLLLAMLLPLTGLVVSQVLIVVPFLLTGTAHYSGSTLIALIVLVGHVAYRRTLYPALAGYVVAAVLPAATIVLDGENAWEFVFFPLILAPAFLVGFLLRREQQRSAELARLARELAVERERRAHTAVVEERARISQELHDAVAHTVSVMTLQAGVVRRRLAQRGMDDGPEYEALVAVEQLGRQSVRELRRVVGILRHDDSIELEPRASLSGLEALAAQVSATGTPVRVEVVGVPHELPPALDMSAYRIVQESLSNTMRHSGDGARAVVTLTWTAACLEIEICDSGPQHRVSGKTLLAEPTPSAAASDGGHGLVGMRERVLMFGGSFTAEPAPDGGFCVHAALPLTAQPLRAPVRAGVTT